MLFFCRPTNSSANKTESKVLIEIKRVEKLIKGLNNTMQETERNVTHFQNELKVQKDEIDRKHKNTLTQKTNPHPVVLIGVGYISAAWRYTNIADPELINFTITTMTITDHLDTSSSSG